MLVCSQMNKHFWAPASYLCAMLFGPGVKIRLIGQQKKSFTISLYRLHNC